MKHSYKVALGITVVAGLWLASGQFDAGGSEEGRPATPESAVTEREPFAVRVARMVAEPMVREVVVNGRSMANRTVDLRAEVRGPVEEVLVDKGARVKAGDVIARIAVEARKAELAQARAALELRRIEYEAAQKLAQKGFNSDVRRAETRAAFEAAQAALRIAELELDKTEIRAPFDGIVDARMVEVGDFVDSKDPVATIVDLDPVKFTASVTERNVVDLGIGNPARVELFGGRVVEGALTYIAAQADENARTFPVEVQAPNPDGTIVAGLTAKLRLPVTRKLAHKISPAVLTLDDQGTIGVKLVEAGDIVRFQPVTIVGSDPQGVWIAGLPETATVVVVGQEFIVPGERVKPVPVAGS